MQVSIIPKLHPTSGFTRQVFGFTSTVTTVTGFTTLASVESQVILAYLYEVLELLRPTSVAATHILYLEDQSNLVINLLHLYQKRRILFYLTWFNFSGNKSTIHYKVSISSIYEDNTRKHKIYFHYGPQRPLWFLYFYESVRGLRSRLEFHTCYQDNETSS